MMIWSVKSAYMTLLSIFLLHGLHCLIAVL